MPSLQTGKKQKNHTMKSRHDVTRQIFLTETVRRMKSSMGSLDRIIFRGIPSSAVPAGRVVNSGARSLWKTIHRSMGNVIYGARVGSAELNTTTTAAVGAAAADLDADVRAVLSDLLGREVALIDRSDVRNMPSCPFDRYDCKPTERCSEPSVLCSLVRPSDPTEAARRLWDALERNGVGGIPVGEVLTAVCNHKLKVKYAIKPATLSEVRRFRSIAVGHGWEIANRKPMMFRNGKQLLTAAIDDDRPPGTIDPAALETIAARFTARLMDALAPIRWDTDVRSVVEGGDAFLDFARSSSSINWSDFPMVAPDRVSEYLRPSEPPLVARRLFAALVRNSFGGLTVADALAAVTGGPVNMDVQTCVLRALRIGYPPRDAVPSRGRMADARRRRGAFGVS